MAKNEHIITLDYSSDQIMESFTHLFGMILFSPYKKGIKYEQSKELTAKIIPMQLLLGGEFELVWNKYIDILNKNLIGLGKLIDDIKSEMEKAGKGKYKIKINVEKL
uniref:Uncharacterized protein n=1 Tax=viral metagenome TaxID=1070528 RepID=A0A6M3L8H4_9ZZZZ